MVGQPDSPDSPESPAAGNQHDLPLNGPTSADQFQDAADAFFKSEVDPQSTPVAAELILERRDVVSGGTMTQSRPRHASVTGATSRTGDADRPWLWRWRSLKRSRANTGLQSATHGEPGTLEAIKNIESQLTGLTTLRDVCVRIDQRLAGFEALIRRKEDAPIGVAGLHDLCVEIYERLARVEAALHRTEGYVADKPWDLSGIASSRLERVEETLRLTEQSLSDTSVRDICENIDARLVSAEDSLRRTEGAVADWLRDLSARISGRLAEAEHTIQRIDHQVSGGTPEETTIRELLARIDSRLDQAEDAARHRERHLENGLVDVAPQPQPHAHTRRGEQADGGVLAAAGLWLRRFTTTSLTNGGVHGAQWVARLSVPVVVVVLAALAIASLIRALPGTTPEKPVASDTSKTAQISSPSAGPAVTRILAQSTARPTSPPIAGRSELTANTGTPISKSSIAVPGTRPSSREVTPIDDKPRAFVGTLTITSVPSGATVSLNGKPAGVTPLKLPRLRAGSVAVQIAQDGYERWSAAVRVPADRLTEVTARLRPLAP